MKNRWTSLSLLVLIVFVFLTAMPSEANEYLLGVGDVLQISVWGHPELTTEVAIRPDGYLTFPLVGDHWAVDKTARQLSKELQEILAEFVINPQVTVIVSQFRTLQVQVLGEVRSTGYYQLKAGSRLLDVLALAGGPTRTADLNRVSITRYVPDALGNDRTEVLQINVNEFINQGHLDANPVIMSGDMIFVPTSGRATIFGEVRQPTSYDLQGGLDILDLLALAGGALDSADLERVVVTSQTAEEPEEKIINVQDLLAGKGRKVQINPNDVVFVPKKQQVIVLGAVRTPGLYVMNNETSLVDILARAGGVLPTGDASAISITRKQGGSPEILLVNATPSLTGKQGGENPRLHPDDLIFVPEGYQNALVLGQVRIPGSYQVKDQTRLLDLLAQAGGTQDRAGDKLILTRAGVTKEIELGSLERLGLQNEQVQPGDVIYIPEGRKQVLILGEVRNPGYFQFRQGDRFLDAIGMAGGLTALADEGQVSLSRQTETGTEIVKIDFGELTRNRYLQENVPLQGGDVIIVPKSDRGVTVLGEVARPGFYRFESGAGLLDAIMLAGGFLESAQEDQVSLSRQTEHGTEVNIIDFSKLMEQKYLEDDLRLRGGDVIMVPKSDRSVLVLGEVRSPGYYVFSKGQRLIDVVARAGGFTPDAETAQVVVTRETSSGVETLTVDMNPLSSTAGNLPLQGGEIITVPRTNRTVLVFGDVVRAGAYTLPPGGRLLDVLALAGGLQSNLSGQDIVLTRQNVDGEQIWQMEFAQLMEAQNEHNLPLAGGDIIYVPASKKQILVLGQVAKPGAYALPAGARVLDAIAMAGGPLERAALENVGIYRDDSLEGSEMIPMGKDKVLFTGDAQENPLLVAGDIVYIPETTKPDWLKIFSFVGAVKTFKDAVISILTPWW